MIFYHPKWIFFRLNDRNEIQTHMRIKCNMRCNESVLVSFASGNFLFTWKSHTCLEMSFQPKLPIWNPHWFEFHFALINMNTSKELTEHQSKIFNRYEISHRFEFILPLIWTYFYEKTKRFETWNHASVLLVFCSGK